MAGRRRRSEERAEEEEEVEMREPEEEEEEGEEEENASSPSARRSGRLRRQPKVDYNMAVLSAVGEENGSEEEEEEEEENESEEEEVTDPEEEEEEDDSEAEEERVGKKRAAPKRRASSSPSASASQAPRRRRKRKKGAADSDGEDADEAADGHANATVLFKALCRGGSSVKMAATGWAKRYARDPAEGAAELVNLVLQAAGSRAALDAEAVASASPEDAAAAVLRLAEAAEVEEGAYPAVASKGSLARFPSRFQEFLGKAVHAARESHLADGTLVPVLALWLGALGASRLGCFRHTALLAANHAVTAMAQVCVANSAQVAVLARHHKAEEAKKGRGNASKLAQLDRDGERLREQTEACEAAQAALFKAVWAKRQADVRADTRRAAISALGGWIAAYPDMWLRDEYLKYLGWFLSDKDEGVRVACLESLARIHADEANWPRLELFLERFKPRFLEMVRDTSAAAAAAAVRLLQSLLRSAVLAEGEGDDVPGRIWDADPGVSAAAAAFAYEDVFAPEDQEAADGETEQETYDRHAEDLEELVKMHHLYAPATSPEAAGAGDGDDEGDDGAAGAGAAEGASDPCVLVDVLVAAMWEHLPFLSNWALLHDRLLATQGELAGADPAAADAPEEVRIKAAQTLTLARVLVSAAARVAAAGDAARGNGRAAEQARAEAERMRAFFVPVLGQLLATFHVDAPNFRELCRLLRLVGPAAFARAQGGAAASMKAALGALRSAYLKHSDPVLLTRVSGLFAELSEERADNQAAADAQAEVGALADDLARAFGPMTGDGAAAAAALEEGGDAERAVVSQLRKMQLLYALNRVAALAYSEELDGLLRTHIVDQGSQEMLRVLLRYHAHEVVWQVLPLLVSSPEDGADPAAVEAAGKRADGLMRHLEDVLCDSSSPPATVHVAYLLSCDLLCLTRPTMAERRPELAPLVAGPSDAAVKALCEHLAAVVSPSPEQARRMQRRNRRSLGSSSSAAASPASEPPFDPSSRATRLETLRAAVLLAAAEPAEYAELAAEVMALHANKERKAELRPVLRHFVARLRDLPGSPLLPVQLSALRVVYERLRGAGEPFHDDVAALASTLAMLHSPNPASRTFWPLLEAAVRYAFEAPPSRFAFLPAAAGHFVLRASRDDVSAAKRLFDRLAANAEDAAGEGEAAASADWSVLDEFRGMLERKLAGRPVFGSASKKARKGRAKKGRGGGGGGGDDDDDDYAMPSASAYKRSSRGGTKRRSKGGSPEATPAKRSRASSSSASAKKKKKKKTPAARVHRARRFV